MLLQIFVGPEIVPGVSVNVLVTVKFSKALLAHAVTDCTDTFPVEKVPPNITEIDVVPCPDRIVELAGAVQLYESAPITAVI